MSRTDLSVWIPEETSSNVLQTIAQTSAVEALATREPMGSDTKTVPSVNGITVSVVAKGGAYPEDATADGEIVLKTRKFGTAIRMAEEDLADSPANVIASKQNEWAKAYAVELDNAALAVTAAENGTTVPFTSVYKTLATASAGYIANANIVKTAGTGAGVTYDQLSQVIAKIEDGAYFGELVVIAHPSFKGHFRAIKDSTGNPIFVQGLAGTPDTVFGYNVVWSRGARTSAVATSAPSGNPLLVAVSKEYLVLGVRSGPESFLADANTGAAMLTDEALLKVRARRAFSLAVPAAAALLEVLP